LWYLSSSIEAVDVLNVIHNCKLVVYIIRINVGYWLFDGLWLESTTRSLYKDINITLKASFQKK
jgi:hypothetical protein